MSPFDPYKKLAQIIDNMNARSAEGEESGVSQISAPLSFDPEKRNEYLQQHISELESMLLRAEQAYQRISTEYAVLLQLYEIERQANKELMSDGLDKDEYTFEFLPTKH